MLLFKKNKKTNSQDWNLQKSPDISVIGLTKKKYHWPKIAHFSVL